jgi:polysaccharide biosynthesis protein VpsQ
MKRAAIGFAICIGLVVVVADVGLGGGLFARLRHIPGGDKTGHFVLMGTLSFLVNMSLGAARLGSTRLLTGSVAVAAVVTLEEFSQLALAARGFSLLDLAANYAGIVCGGWLARWAIVRRA